MKEFWLSPVASVRRTDKTMQKNGAASDPPLVKLTREINKNILQATQRFRPLGSFFRREVPQSR